jgi:hypothetical protein
MNFWQVAQCDWRNTPQLDTLLADHWEPFAVTESHGEATVWLRREVERMEARSSAPRPRLESEVARLARTSES